MSKKNAVRMVDITKTFDVVLANNKICLDINYGEVLALLGENGSGKTTLMNMISGIYFPDDGQIFINGEEVVIRSPKDAFDYKIGMIHQHFKLVDIFSAAQNIVLGLKEEGKFNNEYLMMGNRICVRTLDLSGDFQSIKDQLDEIAEKYLLVKAA